MKRIRIKAFIGITVMTLSMVMASCSDILNEQPRSIYEPGFFETEQGIRGGVTAMYAHLRYIFGNAYFYNTTETGTDEVTYAQSADQNFKVMDISGQGEITSQTSRADVLWGNAFTNINTANGVIENGEDLGVSVALIAEARFFRAFDYFMLVQTFGGVPLDLGAGELAFNNNPVRVSERNTVPEVYTKVIFPDLLTAVNELPENPRLTGTVTKTVARLYLAKAYLTYGWWLENPNNIPTYPETDRNDPDGHDAQWYFQQAYDIATEAIDNPGPFGLQETFYDVNWGPNDRNNEILLYADHTETSQYYNGSDLVYSSGGGADNFAGWMMQWNYTVIASSSSDTEWANDIESVRREAVQSLGRPWTRMAPTIDAITETFDNKTDDSRFDGTFTTSYRANIDREPVIEGPVYNAHFMQVEAGDPILTFLGEEPTTPIDYSISVEEGANIGAGTLPGRSDFVIGPNDISRRVYPGLWKLGTYRTDNGNGLGSPNGASTRPFNIAKFSELYFIAAEAAVKGATGSRTARELINVIRERAAKRKDNTEAENNTAIAAMTAATPGAITIDYILEERSREYYGEGYRWYDLIRTQKWEEVAGTYRIAGNDYGDHDAQTITRNIEPYHYLRPIPQGQLDALQMSAEEKEAYQNPGY